MTDRPTRGNAEAVAVDRIRGHKGPRPQPPQHRYRSAPRSPRGADGVSGSGKSSLAFDTLYAEGQRRLLESLTSFARQMLDQMERPDVDLIEGLPPTVSIDQRAGALNPRSTVATLTEIHDYFRLLFARTDSSLPRLRPGDPPPDPRANGGGRTRHARRPQGAHPGPAGSRT